MKHFEGGRTLTKSNTGARIILFAAGVPQEFEIRANGPSEIKTNMLLTTDTFFPFFFNIRVFSTTTLTAILKYSKNVKENYFFLTSALKETALLSAH